MRIGVSVCSEMKGEELLFIALDGLHAMATHVDSCFEASLSLSHLRCDAPLKDLEETPPVLSIEGNDKLKPWLQFAAKLPFTRAAELSLQTIHLVLNGALRIHVEDELVTALLNFVTYEVLHPVKILVDSAPISPSASTKELVDFVPKLPLIVLLQHLLIEQVLLGVTLTLNVDELDIPAAAAAIRLLTMGSRRLKLQNVNIPLSKVELRQVRGSPADIGNQLLKAYIPSLLSAATSVLGKSNVFGLEIARKWARGVKNTTNRVMGAGNTMDGAVVPSEDEEESFSYDGVTLASSRRPPRTFIGTPARITLYDQNEAASLSKQLM